MVISTKSLFSSFATEVTTELREKSKQTALQLLYFSPWIYIQCFDSLHFLLLNCTDWLSSLNNLYSSACVCAWVLSVLLYLCVYSWIVFFSSLHDSYFNHKKKQIWAYQMKISVNSVTAQNWDAVFENLMSGYVGNTKNM